MNAFIWRLIRIAVLFASCGISLSWVGWLYGWPTWIVITLIPTALIDLWIQNIRDPE